jgi:hydrogenase/urease accessory protein HupE
MKNFFQRAGAVRNSLVILFLLVYPLTAFAHKRGGEAIGFASGFEHPISGLDHILAMVAVGMWGAQLGAPAIMGAAGSFSNGHGFGRHDGTDGNQAPRH